MNSVPHTVQTEFNTSDEDTAIIVEILSNIRLNFNTSHLGHRV